MSAWQREQPNAHASLQLIRMRAGSVDAASVHGCAAQSIGGAGPTALRIGSAEAASAAVCCCPSPSQPLATKPIYAALFSLFSSLSPPSLRLPLFSFCCRLSVAGLLTDARGSSRMGIRGCKKNKRANTNRQRAEERRERNGGKRRGGVETKCIRELKGRTKRDR